VLVALLTKVIYAPEPILYSTLYPLMCAPPVFDGEDHDRLICVFDTDVAVRDVGGAGGFMFDSDGGGAEVVVGVAVASFEFGLPPNVK